MIILHDNPNSDLTHIQAMAEMEEGFASLDYVRMDQSDRSWIGQIIEPNRNISTVGRPLDSTVRHGLELMQSNPDVQSVESVQVFDILILGEYDTNRNQILTPRIRPLPGAIVTKLDADTTSQVIGIPEEIQHEDNSRNVIGELLNTDGVPLCVNLQTFNHHIMIVGGTGSGKSNVAANLIDQAIKFKKCVLVHDAKPDYGRITFANSDSNVGTIWERFNRYGLVPHSASDVTRIGFHEKCDPRSVDDVVGFRASHFKPDMLAGLFFPESHENNQFEGFAGAAHVCLNQVLDPDHRRQHYSLDDILKVVEQRMDPDTDARGRIHESTAQAILRKIETRRRDMPWLDAVGSSISRRSQRRLESRPLNGSQNPEVKEFNLNQYAEKAQILVIDYSQMEDQSYALILSYFLGICQSQRSRRQGVGIVQMVDEAHRIFDNESRHSDTLARSFSRAMREGRSVDHSIILSLQNASQIHQLVMNNLNSHFVMRQNSRGEADSATQTMGRDFSARALHLGTGHALVKMFESRFIVPVQMAPSPFELMRTDNTGADDNNGPIPF